MRLSKVSQILGRGWKSFFVREFSLLKLIQNLKEPSFFRTSTTALYQGLLLSQIAPASNINLRCSLTSSTCGGGILLNRSLNRAASGSLSSITCSAAFVHPISFFSRENKSWYSARRLLACLAALVSQDSSPDRSNFSKSIHCLSSSDIRPESEILTGLEPKSTGGIMLAVTILVMGTPF